MTVIAAVGDGKKVWMGCDGIGMDEGYVVFRYLHPKVFMKGPFLIGTCGSHLSGQLIRRMDPPTGRSGNNESDVWFLRDALWKMLHEKRTWELVCQKDDPQLHQGGFLVGYRGQVWHIGVDGTVDTLEENYFAIGSGAEPALGSLYTTHVKKDCSPHDRVELALRAAEFHLAIIRGPFTILEV